MREINQIIIFMDPDMQDWLQFHLLRLGIVGQNLFAHL